MICDTIDEFAPQLGGDSRKLISFVKDRAGKAPHPDFAKRLLQSAYEHGVILMTAGTHGNVVRFLMPLVMTDEQLNEGLAIVENCIREISEV